MVLHYDDLLKLGRDRTRLKILHCFWKLSIILKYLFRTKLNLPSEIGNTDVVTIFYSIPQNNFKTSVYMVILIVGYLVRVEMLVLD